MKRLFWGIILIAFAILGLYSQELLKPEEEAPPAIFEAQIGDAEVDFFLTGSWKASLIASTGILFGPNGSVIFPSPFPGLEQGLIPRQFVDLTFSVWLMERYFIEVAVLSVLEEQFFEDLFKDIYFRMGYQGKEDEFLKHLYIGNRDIGIAPFRFLDIPEQGDASLGAEALMGSGDSSHHLLLRSDNNEPGTISFIGQNLVTEEVIPLSDYIQGRFFKLPDSGVDDLEVYIEDPDGGYSGNDGYTYRLATLDDAVLDSEEGLVTLKEVGQGRVLVYYRKALDKVGDPGVGLGQNAFPGESVGDKIDLTITGDFDWTVTYLGQLMNDRKVTIGTKNCLRLWQPGEFSPFEILSSYQFSTKPPQDFSQIRVQTIYAGNKSETINTQVKFRFIPEADWFTAFHSSDLRGDFRNLYPFLAPEVEALFDPGNLLYGPARDPRPGYLKYELLVSFLTPVTEYRLGGDIVPGSVQVFRNGIQETRYEVDYDTGVITFLTYINPDDRLDINFRRKTSLLHNSDLIFAWGNIIPLSDAFTLELAGGIRWNALPGNYTEEAYSRTGTILGSASLKGETEKVKFDAYTAVAYTNPDTTGIMRLLSMEGQGIEVALSEDTAYPASLPDSNTGVVLDKLDRGKLYYKNYRSYGLLGSSVLMPIDWDPPSDQIFPYETGSKPGPYKVAGSSAGSDKGESLVLDFELDGNDWVGVQLPIYPGQGLIDLSSIQSISLSYKARDVQGSFKIYLQLGEIGEDLDGDGLDEEMSAASGGFDFKDEGNGVTLLVGSGPKNEGNNLRDSEDIDGSGFLDTEDAASASNIITISTVSISADTGWTKLYTLLDSTQRQQLRRTRSIRLLIVEDGAASSIGKILIDRISLAGTNFWVSGSGFTTLNTREIEEREAKSPPPEELEDAFPEVQDIFHPFGEFQEVLEVDWLGGPGDWKLEGFTKAGTEGIDYRKITLYYRLPSINGGDIHFHLLDLNDSNAKGIHWNFTPSAVSSWSKMEVSLDEGKVYLNGSEIAGSTVTVDSSYGSLSLFRVSLENTTSGTLYMDELHLTEPSGAVGAALGLDLELNLPGELVTLGDHPLIRDLSFKEKAFFAGRGFSTLYGRPSEAMKISSFTELSFALSISDIRMDLSIEAADPFEDDYRVTRGGGHYVKLPNLPFPLVFTDAYGLRERGSGRNIFRGNIFRENSLLLTWQQVFSLLIRSSAASNDDLLTQKWGAELQVTGLAPLGFQTALNLQKSNTGYLLPEGGYFKNWIGGYSLLIPWSEGEGLERKGDLNFSLGLETEPFSPNLSGLLGFQSFDLFAGSRKQRNFLELELALPFTFKTRGILGFSIIPGYRRKLQIMGQENSRGDFGPDLETYFYRTFGQEYFFNRFPIEELFAPEAEDFFEVETLSLEEAFYTPEVFIGLSRSFSSRIRDLFLPSYLEFSIDKEFKKEGDLFDFFNNYRLTARANALNLFGALGAYPLFPFYRTDEFGTALTVTVSADRSELRTSEFLLENFISLEGHKGNSFSLENRLHLQYGDRHQWSDRVGLLYNWYNYPEAGIRLPLVAPEIEENGFWAHQDSIELKFTGEQDGLSYHPLYMMLSHESSIILPEHGYIKGIISIGLDREKASNEEKYLLLGFRAGIEARIDL